MLSLQLSVRTLLSLQKLILRDFTIRLLQSELNRQESLRFHSLVPPSLRLSSTRERTRNARSSVETANTSSKLMARLSLFDCLTSKSLMLILTTSLSKTAMASLRTSSTSTFWTFRDQSLDLLHSAMFQLSPLLFTGRCQFSAEELKSTATQLNIENMAVLLGAC